MSRLGGKNPHWPLLGCFPRPGELPVQVDHDHIAEILASLVGRVLEMRAIRQELVVLHWLLMQESIQCEEGARVDDPRGER